jgi:hypothetical protein
MVGKKRSKMDCVPDPAVVAYSVVPDWPRPDGPQMDKRTHDKNA